MCLETTQKWEVKEFHCPPTLPVQPHTHIYTQTNPRYSTAFKWNLGLVPESRLVTGVAFPAGFSEIR